MARKPLVCANWKGKLATLDAAKEFAEDFSNTVDESSLGQVDVVFFPSAVHASEVKRTFKPGVMIGAQNISAAPADESFTGELAATTAVDIGCVWALIGHQDRRHRANESLEDTANKVQQAQAAGMGVIFCIGELLEEREAGRTVEVCQEQLALALPKVQDWRKFAIVYEPIWAMGTGVAATKEQAQEAHQAVREIVKEKFGPDAAETVRIQYGGTVNARSCEGFLNQPDIDGFLLAGTRPNDMANFVAAVANAA